MDDVRTEWQAGTSMKKYAAAKCVCIPDVQITNAMGTTTFPSTFTDAG